MVLYCTIAFKKEFGSSMILDKKDRQSLIDSFKMKLYTLEHREGIDIEKWIFDANMLVDYLIYLKQKGGVQNESQK